MKNTDHLIIGRLYTIESIAWRPQGVERPFERIEGFKWGTFTRRERRGREADPFINQVRFVFTDEADFDRLREFMVQEKSIEIRFDLDEGPSGLSFAGWLQEVKRDFTAEEYNAEMVDRTYASTQETWSGRK